MMHDNFAPSDQAIIMMVRLRMLFTKSKLDG